MKYKVYSRESVGHHVDRPSGRRGSGRELGRIGMGVGVELSQLRGRRWCLLLLLYRLLLGAFDELDNFSVLDIPIPPANGLSFVNPPAQIKLMNVLTQAAKLTVAKAPTAQLDAERTLPATNFKCWNKIDSLNEPPAKPLIKPIPTPEAIPPSRLSRAHGTLCKSRIPLELSWNEF